MCAQVVLVMLLLTPVQSGVIRSLSDNEIGDSKSSDVSGAGSGSQAGESDPAEVSGRASFSRVGAVAVPASYEPIYIDVIWKDVFSVLEGASEEFEELLGHHRFSAEDREGLARVELRCLHHSEQLVDQIKTLVQFKDHNKRGIFELLGNLLNLGLGLSNRHKVGELQAREDALHHNQEESRRLLEKTRNVTARALEKIQEENALLVARESIGTLCQDINQYLQRMLEAVYFAFEGKVTPALLAPEDLIKLALSVEESLKKQKLRALEKGAAMLLGASKEILLTDQMMRVVVMVPVIADEERVRELWLMNPVELKFEEKLYRVRAHHSFIAVGGGVMMPITAAQMSTCASLHGVYVCTDVRIAEREPMSCISAVYRSDKESMLRYCKFELVKLDQRAHATALGTKHFYLKSGRALQEKCGDRQRAKDVQEGRAVLVGEQCQLTGAGFDILRLPHPSATGSYKPHVSFDHSRADSVIEDVDAAIESGIQQLEERLPKVQPLAQVGNTTWIWIVVGLGVAGLLLGFLGAYMVKCTGRVLNRLGSSGAVETMALEYQEKCRGTVESSGLRHEERLHEDHTGRRTFDVVQAASDSVRAEVPQAAQHGALEEGENVLARVLPGIMAALV